MNLNPYYGNPNPDDLKTKTGTNIYDDTVGSYQVTNPTPPAYTTINEPKERAGRASRQRVVRRMKRTKNRIQRVRSTKKRRAQKLYSTKKRRNQRVRSTKRRTRRIRHKKHVSKRRNKNKYSYKGGLLGRLTQCIEGLCTRCDESVDKDQKELMVQLNNNYSNIVNNLLKEPNGIERIFNEDEEFIDTTEFTGFERKRGSSRSFKGVVEAHKELQGRLNTIIDSPSNFYEDFGRIKTEFLGRIDNDKKIIIRHIDILVDTLKYIAKFSDPTTYSPSRNEPRRGYTYDTALDMVEELKELKGKFKGDVFGNIKRLFICLLDHMARAKDAGQVPY